MKKIDFTHEDRTAIMAYIAAKEAKAKAEAAEKKAKAEAKAVMEKLGKAFKDTDKTSYIYGTVQVQGKAKAVVYRETVAKGAVDWQELATKLALAQGYDMEDLQTMAEGYRKTPNTRTALDWATTKQAEELGL